MSKVLIADDHLVTRKMLQAILEKNGYQVIVAEDGLRAWEIIKTEPGLHLAVIDWMMPGMNGVDLCHKLHEDRKNCLLYVILLSAKEGTDNIIEALQAGANDYISKPFEKEELLARLRVGERIMKLQRQLTQAQKLESIGQLASGIAHEINTPIQYIGDNINFLQDSFKDILRLLTKYEQVQGQTVNGAVDTEHFSQIQDIVEEIDISYLTEEIPQAIQQALEGVKTIADIVQAMKEFAHPGSQGKTTLDINHALKSTITVARNRWKYVADMETDLDPELPPAHCVAGEFNQVILNLIINAADAIAEKLGESSEDKGVITIITRQDGDWVEISISDTGAGIPQAICDRVYDPFFTTKEVGKGSGQGLAIAYSIVADKNGGTITFESKVGQGTTFIVRLPVAPDELPKDMQDEGAYSVC